SDPLQQLIGIAKGIVVVGHEYATLKIDDAIGNTAARAPFVPAKARGPCRIVCRTQDPTGQGRLISIGGVHVIDDLAFVPDVVAGGDDVNAEFEQLFGNLWSDAEATSRVLAVGNGEFNIVLPLQFRQTLVNDSAPGASENVTDEKYAQAVAVLDWRYISMLARDLKIGSCSARQLSRAQKIVVARRT